MSITRSIQLTNDTEEVANNVDMRDINICIYSDGKEFCPICCTIKPYYDFGLNHKLIKSVVRNNLKYFGIKDPFYKYEGFNHFDRLQVYKIPLYCDLNLINDHSMGYKLFQDEKQAEYFYDYITNEMNRCPWNKFSIYKLSIIRDTNDTYVYLKGYVHI